MLFIIWLTEDGGNAGEELEHIDEVGRADEQFVGPSAEADPVAVTATEAQSVGLIRLQEGDIAAHRVVQAIEAAGVAGSLVQHPGNDHTRVAPGGVAGAGPTRGRWSDISIRAGRELGVYEIVEPLVDHVGDIGVEESRRRKDLQVGGPTQAFVALRAVGGDADEVGPQTGDDVPLQRIHQWV